MSQHLAQLKIILYKVRIRLKLVLTSVWDQSLYHLSRMTRQRRAAVETAPARRRILYLCELTPARAGRMARILGEQTTFEIILFCHTDGYVPEFIEGNFQQVVRYRNQWHLKRLLDAWAPVGLIHAFAPKSYYPEIARQHTGAPYIQDMQDVVVTYHGLTPPYAWAREELIYEKSALTNATVVAGHSLEPRAGFQLYGIAKRPRTIYLPLGCDESVFRQPVHADLSGDIHLVYAGGLAGSHRDRTQFGILQFHHLIEVLSAQQIHFHVYPSPSTLPPDYEEYIGIARENPYFHLHDPVPHHELTRELAQYHFGLLPFFREDSALQVAKMTYSTSLKLFNFLEAGLPVIISRDIIYQHWMVMRGRAGVSVSKADIPDLGERLRSLDYQALLAQVRQYRQQLSLQQHLKRLATVYRSLLP
ncbi:MAG: hypothetical protein SF053_05510 [Bacteroidia bacterium]|nr:hypothetical protein [Bacteroidia bacterium]